MLGKDASGENDLRFVGIVAGLGLGLGLGLGVRMSGLRNERSENCSVLFRGASERQMC